MRLCVSVSLLALLFAGALPALAQDDTQAILAQPSMSVVATPGARSMPVTTTPEAKPIAKAQAVPQTKPVEAIQETVQSPEPLVEVASTEAAQTDTSLHDILARAYTDSPTLRAEREILRQQYENVALAEANRRPIVTADGGVAWVNSDTDPGVRDDFVSSDVGLSITQYLYRGGRTLAQIEQQLRLSDAAMAAYDAATQSTFVSVVTAAMDIQQARATIAFTEQNRTLIDRQLSAAQRGFDVGELTRTDVAQSQARLSGADAALMSAQASYADALSRFAQYAGQNGNDLTIDVDAVAPDLPSSLEAAKTQAMDKHPSIRAALASEQAAQEAVRLAEGALWPEVYAQGAITDAHNPSAVLDQSTTASLGLRVGIPLYEGGATRAEIRQAKYGAMEQRDRVDEARRAVEQAVVSAWSNYQSAKAAVAARKKQVAAAQMARDGVYKEREVGTRTVLDTLDADAELLDARVGLTQARRDTVVAGYVLLAAMGDLSAEALGFYNTESEKAHLDAARTNLFGTGVEESSPAGQ